MLQVPLVFLKLSDQFRRIRFDLRCHIQIVWLNDGRTGLSNALELVAVGSSRLLLALDRDPSNLLQTCAILRMLQGAASLRLDELDSR